MAKTSTSPNQVSPADQRAAYLESVKPRLNGLRLVQERARMAESGARKRLLSTPKDSPERAYRSNQFKQARDAHRAAKTALMHAQTVVDIQIDSMKQDEADAIKRVERALAKQAKGWHKEVVKAAKPFEFQRAVKIVKIRATSVGMVRAPCGVGCADSETMAIHRKFCPLCQAQVAAESQEA
jgi:hypothetical protein